MKKIGSVNYEPGKHLIKHGNLFVCVQRYNKDGEFVIAILIIIKEDDGFVFILQDFSFEGEKINEIKGIISDIEVVTHIDDMNMIACFSNLKVFISHKQFRAISEYINSEKESRIIKSNEVRSNYSKKFGVTGEIFDQIFTLENHYERGGELTLDMKHIDKDGNNVPLQLLINMEKVSEFVFDVSYINSDGYLIKEKSGNVQKPYIIERVDDRTLLVRVFNVNLKATDMQYESLIDYINSKRIPLPDSHSADLQSNTTNENICDIISDVLIELKSINKKLSHIVGSGNTSLDDIQNSLSNLFSQLDNIDAQLTHL